MGTRSYIVQGKWSADSWTSCSHGAGRRHSRTKAKKLFTTDDLARQMAGKVWLEDRAKSRSTLVVVAVTAPSAEVLVRLRQARDHASRHYAEPLDLEQLASVAALSKYHFHRLFTETYGMTPATYLSERRIERAQDLLRATNLTVTEVCMAVGFASLGSFSTRFRDVVGETPSQFQRRYADGAPRIPGCHLFMAGLVERKTASEEKPSTATIRTV